MKRHGPWTIRETKEIYRDPWVRLQRDEVIRPDGRAGTYAVVELKPGVCVIAIDDDNKVHLTEEFHYAVGRVTIEGVSGGIDDGEDATEAAQRELQEELGITASDLTQIGCVDPFTANVRSPTRLFLARRLSFGEHAQEGTEQIRRIVMSFPEALAAVQRGEITHSPTCVALLLISHRGELVPRPDGF